MTFQLVLAHFLQTEEYPIFQTVQFYYQRYLRLELETYRWRDCMEKKYIGLECSDPQSRQSAKLSCFSSRRIWDSPNPSPAGEYAPPPLVYRGKGHTRWRERGWESPNSDEGTYTGVLCIYMYFVLWSLCRLVAGPRTTWVPGRPGLPEPCRGEMAPGQPHPGGHAHPQGYQPSSLFILYTL